ncbi:MAG: AMP-binding protein, partial [Actinomycetota bacterium]|nr:AMP-binding protein [Actinomycetota bacterium]
LAARGVRAGDLVGVALAPGVDFAAALHGCLLLGAPAVPVDLRLTAAERETRMRGVAARVEEPLDGPPLADVPQHRADAVATVMYTSGSTAVPKRVSLTYGNWLWNALGSAVALELDAEERWLCPMPLTHVGGLSILLRSTIYGTTVVLPGRFEVETVKRELSDPERWITLVSLVPTMLARLLDAGLKHPPTLRWALLGGGPIPPALIRRARAAGVPVASTYGMTEACSQIATRGWPLAGVELQVTADGEILVRGPIVAPGALSPDGWLHTGDFGTLSESGRLTVIGRQSDTIVTGGENVAPAEVEAVLLEHEGVADAAVHARPDAEWGERLVASVVLREGGEVSPAELRRHCAARLASFKVPKSVELTDALPRTPSGKLLRGELH